MSEKAAAAAAEKPVEGKADEEVTEQKPAAKSASDKTEEKAAEQKPAKQDKSYSKTEMEAEITKRIAAEKKKWDDEKDLTELERLKKENADLQAANRLRDAKDEVVAALKAAGNNSPELAFRAIQGDLKFDDSGKLINSKDLIDSFKTSYPEQFGTPKPDDGIDAGAGQGQKGTKLTAAQLEKMTPAEVAKLPWEEVSAAMAAKN